MNIKDKLYVSYNICLIVLILIFGFFSISWHFNKILQLTKLNGVIEYIADTKGEYLTQKDVNYFLNKIKEIETN